MVDTPELDGNLDDAELEALRRAIADADAAAQAGRVVSHSRAAVAFRSCAGKAHAAPSGVRKNCRVGGAERYPQLCNGHDVNIPSAIPPCEVTFRSPISTPNLP